MKKRVWLSSLLSSAIVVALPTAAAPVTYKIDPRHTYPSFEADHMGGLSTWRGKFNSSSGTIVLDREAQSGTLEVTVDAASIDFGLDDMNEHAKSDDMFDVSKYPTIRYEGQFTEFKDGQPVSVDGALTMHGVTKPVKLTIDRFKCAKHRRTGKEVCGANAIGELNREDFGIAYGKDMGFHMDVKIEIQVEAVRQ